MHGWNDQAVSICEAYHFGSRVDDLGRSGRGGGARSPTTTDSSGKCDDRTLAFSSATPSRSGILGPIVLYRKKGGTIIQGNRRSKGRWPHTTSTWKHLRPLKLPFLTPKTQFTHKIRPFRRLEAELSLHAPDVPQQKFIGATESRMEIVLAFADPRAET